MPALAHIGSLSAHRSCALLWSLAAGMCWRYWGQFCRSSGMWVSPFLCLQCMRDPRDLLLFCLWTFPLPVPPACSSVATWLTSSPSMKAKRIWVLHIPNVHSPLYRSYWRAISLFFLFPRFPQPYATGKDVFPFLLMPFRRANCLTCET